MLARATELRDASLREAYPANGQRRFLEATQDPFHRRGVAAWFEFDGQSATVVEVDTGEPIR
jgi:hypothetical protein